MCGNVASAFQFTISGVHWTVFPATTLTQCDAINGTFTLSRELKPILGGPAYSCQWHYRYIGGFGASCFCDWLLTVAPGTGGAMIWYLRFLLVGSCSGYNVGWDGYCTTTGCVAPVTFVGQQCDYFTCPSCCSGGTYRDATFPTTITLTAL